MACHSQKCVSDIFLPSAKVWFSSWFSMPSRFWDLFLSSFTLVAWGLFFPLFFYSIQIFYTNLSGGLKPPICGEMLVTHILHHVPLLSLESRGSWHFGYWPKVVALSVPLHTHFDDQFSVDFPAAPHRSSEFQNFWFSHIEPQTHTTTSCPGTPQSSCLFGQWA